MQDGATPFETLLLSAGRSDALSVQSRERIHLGLGFGGGAIAAAAITSSLKASAAKSALLSSGSAALLGAVGAVAVWFGAHGVIAARTELDPRARERAATLVQRLARTSAPLPAVAPTAEPAAIADVERKSSAVKSNAVARTPFADSLASELNVIESARKAMARRDYPLTLRVLDDYASRFPKQSLRSEATVLRVETLAASGATDAAHQLAKSFLATHPNGPYARRLRSLLSETAETKSTR